MWQDEYYQYYPNGHPADDNMGVAHENDFSEPTGSISLTHSDMGAPPPWARARGRRRRVRGVHPGRGRPPWTRRVRRFDKPVPKPVVDYEAPTPLVPKPHIDPIQTNIRESIKGASENVVKKVTNDLRSSIRAAADVARRQVQAGVVPRRAIRAGVRASIRRAFEKAPEEVKKHIKKNRVLRRVWRRVRPRWRRRERGRGRGWAWGRRGYRGRPWRRRSDIGRARRPF